MNERTILVLKSSRRVLWRTLIVLFALFVPVTAVRAQTGTGPVGWSSPENISNSLTKSHHQYIVADDYGYVHVFWSESLGGTEIQMDAPAEAEQDTAAADEATGSAQGEPGNTLYYRRWNGYSWTPAVDLFFSNSGGLSYPIADVDDNGMLYLVWVSPEGVHFSSAPAHEATSAHAWEPATILAPMQGVRPALVASGNGKVDVVYDTTLNVETVTKNGNIYFIQSNDQGATWSNPVQISAVDPAGESIAVWPRLALDSKERLHIVWHEADPPSYLGTTAYYARSDDSGATWSWPRKVDEATQERKWANTINIGLTKGDEVHLVWVCGVLPERCHQWSSDGGATWSPVHRQVFGDLHSRANWDALVTDPDGNLYWIMQLRHPSALYYSYWDEDHWVDPPLIVNDTDPLVSVGHGVQATISQGNQLHLVVHHPEIFEIWHVMGESTLAGSQEPQATPTPTPTPEPVATTVAAAPEAEPTAAPPLTQTQFTDSQVTAQVQSPADTLMTSILPVIFLIGAVGLWRVLKDHPFVKKRTPLNNISRSGK